jgi:hypothetical protein
MKHGMRNSREYSTWNAMLNRCCNPRAKDYPKYGAKGIAVCPEWRQSFEVFFSHIGPRPPGTTIDRIDNTKGYEPGNVRWATPRQQARNRTTSRRWNIKGIVFESAQAAADHFGVSDQTIHRWVNGSFDPRRGTGYPKREDCHAL